MLNHRRIVPLSFLSLLCWLSLNCHTDAFIVPSSTNEGTRIASYQPIKTFDHHHHQQQHYHSTSQQSTALNVVGGGTELATAAIALPKLSSIVASCLTPTLLGYYKYEYGVSYAYGTATAGTAYLILRSLLLNSSPISSSTPFTLLAQLHTTAIVFYGIRLNLFLLYREICIDKFRKFRDKIEEKNTKKNPNKSWLLDNIMSRTPFVLSCSLLYAGLAIPALISAKMSMSTVDVLSSKKTIMTLYKVLVYGTWFGFGLGAIGDINKSLIKKIKGEDHLVTGGIYRFFRHPNYTGEIIGWTSSFLACITSIFLSSSSSNNNNIMFLMKSLIGELLTSIVGVFGIVFVLLSATAGLEQRQKIKYGNTEQYQNWVKKSWKGFALAKKD